MKRVTTIFSGVPGTPYYSNHYFADADSAQDCIDAVLQFWVECAPQIVNECAWSVLAEVATIDPVTGQPTAYEVASGGANQGTNTSIKLPPTSQLLIQWATNSVVAGHRLRGRTFVPAIGTNQSDEGAVASSARTQIAAAGQSLIDDVNTTLLIWSKTHGETRAATTADCWNQFAVLRSRRD